MIKGESTLVGGTLAGRLPSLVRVVLVSVVCCIAAAGCGGTSAGPTGKGAASPSSDRIPVVDSTQLQSVLPTGRNMPADLGGRTVDAWDSTKDPSQCQDEEWPDAWCARAGAVGLSVFTNLVDQEIGIHLVSFPDERSAAQAFKTRDKTDDVDRYPGPTGELVYTLDLVAPEDHLLWTGRGTTFQQGTVIGRIEYSWTPGTHVQTGRLLAVTRMVIQRIDEKEKGLNPTASAR
ncbi:hypothetical protein ACF073_38020 [Streptomyces sp. NPDC015171]|uniref:hypothetical protein n=1 Tax=Streptomyces sp. NPDC015171 TaxID=3364945 RepID=UPI0036FD3C10